jgi:hypothetical protein
MTEGAPKREVRFDPNEILLELFNEEGENVGKLIPYYDALSFFGLDDTDIELNGQTFEQRANKMLIAQDNLESKILPEYTGLLYQLFKYVIDGFANKIDLENFLKNKFDPKIFIQKVKILIYNFGFTGQDIREWPAVRYSLLFKIQEVAENFGAGEFAIFTQDLVDVGIISFEELANIPSVKKRISEITLLQDKIPLVIDGVAVLEEISELNFDGLIPNQELIDKCLLLFELPDDFLDIDTRYFQQRIRDRKRKILKQLQNVKQ